MVAQNHFPAQVCELPARDAEWLACVLGVLRERKGVDFSGYRAPTLLRRIRNRMITARATELPEYLRRLLADPGEADALLGRLTIKVSRFFRNPTTFDALAEAVARLRAERGGRAVQAWSAGCGQGEEAYSLAMVLAETGQAPDGPDVLGTDVDAAAISAAIDGEYDPSAVRDVPAELAHRYLEQRASGRCPRVRVGRELRARVVFRQHDLGGSSEALEARRFDLVCCRNVLIYLGKSLQERVEQLLWDRLRPGGVLCLGEAEWLLPRFAPAFEVLDRRGRIFRRRQAGDWGPR